MDGFFFLMKVWTERGHVSPSLHRIMLSIRGKWEISKCHGKAKECLSPRWTALKEALFLDCLPLPSCVIFSCVSLTSWTRCSVRSLCWVGIGLLFFLMKLESFSEVQKWVLILWTFSLVLFNTGVGSLRSESLNSQFWLCLSFIKLGFLLCNMKNR